MVKTLNNDELWELYVQPALENKPVPADALAVLSAAPRGCLTGKIKDPNHELLDGIVLNDNAKFFAALICGAEINNEKGNPLTVATEFGRIDIINFLLDNGADTQTGKNRALFGAAQNGNIRSMSLLLEKGAFVEEKWFDIVEDSLRKVCLSEALSLQGRDKYSNIIKLLKAQDAIELWIKKLAGNEENTPTARHYAYVAAAIATSTGLDIPAFLEKQYVLLTQRYEQRYPRNKAYSSDPPKLIDMVKTQMDALGSSAYTNINFLLDTMNICAEAAILPQMIPPNYDGKDEKKNEELAAQAKRVTASILLNNMDLEQIFAFSNSSHQPENGIPTHIRNLKSGKWQRLMDDFVTNNGLKIIALANTKELETEGERLKHCVGQGGYDNGCLYGKHHILSIRTADDETSLATLCVDDKFNILKNQFYGRYDSAPPLEAQTAWKQLLEAVTNKEFILNTPLNKQWGETKESIAAREARGISKIERTIGYCFSEIPEKAKKCSDHFHEKLKYTRELSTLKDHQPHEHMGWHTNKYETMRRTGAFPIPDFSPENFRKTLAECANLLSTEDRESFGIDTPAPLCLSRTL